MLFYADEIRVDEGVLKMGKYVDLANEDVIIPVPYSSMQSLSEIITSMGGNN
ncbi:hypothetical protein H8D85_02170 [bacterium]|nr:hypothetical protein [bacterium]